MDSTHLLDYPIILGEIKSFFVNNWNKLVVLPSLEQVPSQILVDLMRLRVSDDIKKKYDAAIDEMREDSNYKKETLAHTCARLYDSEEGTDGRIIIGSTQFQIHRYIILANAPGSYLSSGLVNSEELNIDCQNPVEISATDHIIRFIYSLEFINKFVGLEEAHAIWQAGLFIFDHPSYFESQLCKWFMSGLDQKVIFKILTEVEEKPFAQILRDAALEYVTQNIGSIGKQLQMSSFPKPLLIAILRKFSEENLNES